MVGILSTGSSNADKILARRELEAKAYRQEELEPKVELVTACLVKKINCPECDIDSNLQGTGLSISIRVNTPDSNKQGKAAKAGEILDQIKKLFHSDDDVKIRRSNSQRNPVIFTVSGNVNKMADHIKRSDLALYEQTAGEIGLKSGHSL